MGVFLSAKRNLEANMGRYILKIDTYSESTGKEVSTDCIEKRKSARIPICAPISCVSIGPDSKPLDFNMGIIKDVSQTGVGIGRWSPKFGQCAKL